MAEDTLYVVLDIDGCLIEPGDESWSEVFKKHPAIFASIVQRLNKNPNIMRLYFVIGSSRQSVEIDLLNGLFKKQLSCAGMLEAAVAHWNSHFAERFTHIEVGMLTAMLADCMDEQGSFGDTYETIKKINKALEDAPASVAGKKELAIKHVEDSKSFQFADDHKLALFHFLSHYFISLNRQGKHFVLFIDDRASDFFSKREQLLTSCHQAQPTQVEIEFCEYKVTDKELETIGITKSNGTARAEYQQDIQILEHEAKAKKDLAQSICITPTILAGSLFGIDIRPRSISSASSIRSRSRSRNGSAASPRVSNPSDQPMGEPVPERRFALSGDDDFSNALNSIKPMFDSKRYKTRAQEALQIAIHGHLETLANASQPLNFQTIRFTVANYSYRPRGFRFCCTDAFASHFAEAQSALLINIINRIDNAGDATQQMQMRTELKQQLEKADIHAPKANASTPLLSEKGPRAPA